MEYVQRLIDLRKEMKLSQTDLAEVLQTTQQQISKYEKFTQELPIHHLITLAQFYNVTTDYILGLTDVKRPLFIDVSDHAFILGTASSGKTATAKHLQEILADKLSDNTE